MLAVLDADGQYQMRPRVVSTCFLAKLQTGPDVNCPNKHL